MRCGRHGLAFTEHEYRYERKGGTRVSSRELACRNTTW